MTGTRGQGRCLTVCKLPLQNAVDEPPFDVHPHSLLQVRATGFCQFSANLHAMPSRLSAEIVVVPNHPFPTYDHQPAEKQQNGNPDIDSAGEYRKFQDEHAWKNLQQGPNFAMLRLRVIRQRF
jgi:hypothetical protein